jgi:hypothetical protein
MAGRGSKPGERRGGRQAGSPNTLPDLRALTLKALMRAGGVDYLQRQAEENPMAFMSLLGRVMPREAHVELTGELKVRAEVRRDLVEKLVVLMRTPATAEHGNGAGTVIDAKPLPAIAHKPDTMLEAQRVTERERLGRRAIHARDDGAAAVSGAVQRAAAMHMERTDTPRVP